MLAHYSVKDLYPLALAEGEGMGTAYEYFVKRLALSRSLIPLPRPQTVLIAGLPEKYGASLDFVLLATELGAELTVIDDRQYAIDRLRGSLIALQKLAGAPLIEPPAAVFQTDLDNISSIRSRFDLVVSSEVLQRLAPDSRAAYIGRLRQMSSMTVLFCPNADNHAHNTRSGLAGLRLDELRDLTTSRESGAGDEVLPAGRRKSVIGYIDMPPFPPGITRTAEQRDEATSGRFEAAIMWGLGRYAHMERLIPSFVRHRQSHIVYAMLYN